MLFGLVQGGFPRGVLPRRWGPNPLPPLWSCALLGMFLSFLLGCIPTHLHRHQEGNGCVSDPTFRLQRVRGNPSCAPPARGLSDTDPNEHAKSINPFWLIGSCAARSRSRDHRTCRGFAVQGCAEPLCSRGRGSSGCHHIALRRSGGVNAVLPVLLPKLHPKRCRVEMWGFRLRARRGDVSHWGKNSSFLGVSGPDPSIGQGELLPSCLGAVGDAEWGCTVQTVLLACSRAGAECNPTSRAAHSTAQHPTEFYEPTHPPWEAVNKSDTCGVLFLTFNTMYIYCKQ